MLTDTDADVDVDADAYSNYNAGSIALSFACQNGSRTLEPH